MSRLESGLSLLLAVLLGCPSLVLAQGVELSQPPAPSQPPQAEQQPKHPAGHKTNSKKNTKPEEPPLPPYVAAPLSPLPLEDMPAIPPQVLFQDGQLTIVSENSTLVDILREVRKLTGADFDIPAGATERVVTAIGPGPARDVLAKLLNGTHFNYVMVGSNADPTVLERVVLTPKPSGGAEVASANRGVAFSPPRGSANPAAPRRMEGAIAASDPDDDPDMSAEQVDDTPPPDQQPAAAQAAPPPSAPPAASNTVETPQGPKTPEQLLEELQQRMNLRRQLQEQQNRSSQPGIQPPPPPPSTTSPPDQ